MEFNYNLTDKVKEFVKDSDLENIGIGCSNSQVIKVKKEQGTYYLKISKKGLLTSEFEKLKWLQGKLNVPKIILYDASDNTEYLITESVQGEMVCSDYYIKNPDIGIKVIADAFNSIYSVDIEDCPFNVAIDYKLSIIENNVKNKLIKEEDLKQETLEKYGSLDNVLKY